MHKSREHLWLRIFYPPLVRFFMGACNMGPLFCTSLSKEPWSYRISYAFFLNRVKIGKWKVELFRGLTTIYSRDPIFALGQNTKLYLHTFSILQIGLALRPRLRSFTLLQNATKKNAFWVFELPFFGVCIRLHPTSNKSWNSGYCLTPSLDQNCIHSLGSNISFKANLK